MNFFEHQEQARRQTGLLVLYFVLAVVLIMIAVYVAAVGAYFVAVGSSGDAGVAGVPWGAWWQPQVALTTVVVVSAVVSLGTLWKLRVLRRGGVAVAEALGGRKLLPGTDDPAERRLVNVVEEIAIASGTPVPALYVLDGEEAINAFAAGHSPADAAIGVTRGCIEQLTRDELQGVIAHEFSHILNSDMRLNLRLMGVLNGILWLAIIGRVVVESLRYGGTSRRRYSSSSSGGSGSNKGGNPLAAILLLGFALLAIGYIGVFFASLIKAAVSRQREFLADASAVQFTRQPAGLASALRKVGGLSAKGRLGTPRAQEASHMFVVNALRQPALGGLATHPPLAERIRRIDPTWDGKFRKVGPDADGAALTPEAAAAQRVAAEGASAARAGQAVAGLAAGFAGHEEDAREDERSTPSGERAPSPARVAVPAATITDRVGTMTPEQLVAGTQLVRSLPEALRRAAHDPFSAREVVYCLLLDRTNETTRKHQLDVLAASAEEAAYVETRKLWPHVAKLDARARLPLVALAVPALKQLSPAQHEAFRAKVRLLVEADAGMDLFEYALEKTLARHLDRSFGKRPAPTVRHPALKPLAKELAMLLWALAHHGHGDEAAAERAFLAGAGRARRDQRIVLPRLARDECGVAAVDAALDRLAEAAPAVKAQVIDACAHVVAADGAVELGEAELLRAICDALDCPMPPFLAAA